MCSAETHKSLLYVRAAKEFGSRDVVLDAFMVWATRSKEGKGGRHTGPGAVGN
jgi:hypothetical protein